VGVARLGGPRRGACGCAQRFPDLEPGSRGWAEFIRVYALMAVEQWGIEPLSLDGIEDAARIVQYLCSVADPAGKLGSTE
jgi:hypothetical protein